jgi:hypothetical protein
MDSSCPGKRQSDSSVGRAPGLLSLAFLPSPSKLLHVNPTWGDDLRSGQLGGLTNGMPQSFPATIVKLKSMKVGREMRLLVNCDE